MADRRVTVLNPAGYQEVLQTSDRLVVDSTSSFAGATFSQDVSLQGGTVVNNITINGTPTQDTHAATVLFVNDRVDTARVTATSPIEINSQVIGIAYATNTTDGSIRIATDAEASAGTLNTVAVTPQQLVYALDDINISASSPLNVTESPANSWQFTVDAASNTAAGIIRLATDAEANAQTLETVAVNPKQVKDAIDGIPYATSSVNGLIQLADGTEVTTGTANNVAVTPAQLAQEVNSVDITASLPLTVSQTGRVFDLDINQATTTTTGILRLATSSEMTAGTATDVAITPNDLETRLSGLEIVQGSTTVKGLVRFATNSETQTGTETEAAVTPVSMRYALDAADYVLDGGTY